MSSKEDLDAVAAKEARAAARAAKKAAEKEARLAKKAGGDTPKPGDDDGESTPGTPRVGLTGAKASNDRVATGILTSEKRARDIKIDAFSLSLHGIVLVEDTTLELNAGGRYGLIGRNGCGKTTMLQCLAAREVPIPAHIDTYLLDSEADPSELTALEYVLESAQKEVSRLEKLAEQLLADEGPESELLHETYARHDELDPSTFVPRASSILCGLGFDPKTLHKKTKDMSGGWRMRVALAKALFLQPTFLLLDEPTNHLDLNACVWLEEYLAGWPENRILLLVSHSQDFLDGVCTDTMVMERRKLKNWSGSYSSYVKTREEQDRNQLTLFKKQQEEIAHIKAFIASCGTYANLVRQAKSREKQLEKMIEAGLIEEPYVAPRFRFRFPDPGAKLAPPLVSFSDASFSYSGKKEDYLFNKVSFGIDADSRIALVGPNGAGKSTLLKLIVGQNQATEGSVSVKGGVCIGRYHQHSTEVLDLNATPCEYVARKLVELGRKEQKEQELRSVVGSWGIPSEYHLEPMRKLSEGLKSRMALCEIALKNPNLLLMDEPTNPADMEMIDSLAEAINAFQGGVVVVSHDFRLLSQIAKEIWVIDHGITIWKGDIRSYKASLAQQVRKQQAALASK